MAVLTARSDKKTSCDRCCRQAAEAHDYFEQVGINRLVTHKGQLAVGPSTCHAYQYLHMDVHKTPGLWCTWMALRTSLILLSATKDEMPPKPSH